MALQGVDWKRQTIDIITIENASHEVIAFLKTKGITPALCWVGKNRTTPPNNK